MSLAWTAAEARAATGGRLLGRAEWRAEGVSIDSRSVKPGELFVALQGPSFDGHDFVAAASAKGRSQRSCIALRWARAPMHRS